MDALIVEDTPEWSGFFEDVLRARGHRVTVCADAESGWESFQTMAQPLILLDWLLPGMDGLELCRMIRAHALGDRSLVLMITARESTEDLQRALEAGADDFVNKPVSVKHLNVRLEIAERRLEEIEARRRAEEELREREELYRSLAENTSVGIWHLTPEGDTVYANPAMCALLDVRDRHALEGQSWKRFFTAESWRIVERERDRHRIGLASTYEVMLLSGAGRRRNVIVCSAPLFNEDEELGGIIGTFTDVTEHRRAEQERVVLEERLQQVQKIESLEVLAGGVAHDFNNLLLGVLGNAELALMDLPPESPVAAKIKQILAAGQRGAELTDQMLAYSGKGKFVVEQVDLSRLVNEMVPLLRAAISKGAVLDLHLDRDLPAVEGDTSQLRQVVLNLVSNASEALLDSEGVVTVSTGVIKVDQETRAQTYLAEQIPEGDYVHLSVADTGSGMTPETQAKVFDPFFTTKFTGRGLGLAATLGIVRGHHGAIMVRSEAGRGALFRVLLPCSRKIAAEIRPDAAEAPTGVAAEPGPGSGTVLVVDDEEAVRQVAREILERFGYAVLVAGDGDEGIGILRERPERIDAVLLDLTMPHTDGEQALAEMLRIRPELRVILTSGYGERETTERFKGKGIASFIQKPYPPLKLIEMVRRVLSDTQVAPGGG
jgi:two-component system cell cycle sensor histidine kinase/response regulator CckA